MSSAQHRFDEKYISSREIVKRLGISRPVISIARKRGLLPDEVVVNNSIITLWERATVEPYLQRWEADLNAKRAAKA